MKSNDDKHVNIQQHIASWQASTTHIDAQGQLTLLAFGERDQTHCNTHIKLTATHCTTLQQTAIQITSLPSWHQAPSLLRPARTPPAKVHKHSTRCMTIQQSTWPFNKKPHDSTQCTTIQQSASLCSQSASTFQDITCERLYVCVFVRVCVLMCVSMCVYVCVCVFERVCVRV